MIGVYAIVHAPTNRGYVGSANNISRRFKEHRTKLRGGQHHSQFLQNAWSKYGEREFEFRRLAHVESLGEARDLEQAFLDCFYSGLLNCRATATGFPEGEAHHAKKPEWHMKTIMQRLTPEERKAKYGKTKGTKRDGSPYVAGAAKRLSDLAYRAKLSEACRGKREVVQCPHCGLEGGGGNMRRYHFDNCKGKS